LSLSLQEFQNLITPETPITIYTDGACSKNPGPGGWGAILIVQGKELEMSGSEKDTTNNRMEMMAAIKGLEILPPHSQVTLFTDSQYLKNGITLWIKGWKKNGWKTADKNPVKNQDLWVTLDALLVNKEISWQWIKAHNGNAFNERVDGLAKKSIIAAQIGF
jgi:ribonuclease HI